ncbi:MAG: hypothetical protein SGARI_001517 [Bacillariaceae sp.]
MAKMISGSLPQCETGARQQVRSVPKPFQEWFLSISDQRDGDVDECVDGDWEAIVTDMNGNDNVYTCSIITKFVCVDGEINLDEELLTALSIDFDFVDEPSRTGSGLTFPEACCACGGGSEASTFSDTLNGWTIEVFGAVGEVTDPEDTGDETGEEEDLDEEEDEDVDEETPGPEDDEGDETEAPVAPEDCLTIGQLIDNWWIPSVLLVAPVLT